MGENEKKPPVQAQLAWGFLTLYPFRAKGVSLPRLLACAL